jgi:hypothetical protein
MPKRPGPLDEYVAEVEAHYGDFKSNRTLVAELVSKERAQERLLYKEVARIVSALWEQWDQEKHAALSEDEQKDVHYGPELLIYPDGSRKFSCSVHISHLDFSWLGIDIPLELQMQVKKHLFMALSFDEFKHVIASAYDLTLPYVKAGYQPTMYSVRTITPEIHFPGYCPSPIPAYVSSLRKYYSEPPMFAYSGESVAERLVEVRPWCPIPDEPSFTLITYSLNNDTTLYNIASVCAAFYPLMSLRQEKSLRDGIAILERDMYALAWQGITPFAREMT